MPSFCTRLSDGTPPLRRLSQSLPVPWCFAWTYAAATLSYALDPHAARLAKPLTDMLAGHESRRRLRRRARDYLLYRRWQNRLEKAWRHWAGKHDRFVRVEGGEKLAEALRQGCGAILLSGHYYGFDRMVDPVLAQQGFPITRWASAVDPVPLEDRWGAGDFAKWNYINFRGDGWHATRMILKVREDLQRNRAIHLSVLGHAHGRREFQLDFKPKNFFLDPKTFELLETLKALVLPCFATLEENGKILIRIYPPAAPQKRAIMNAFGPLYSKYLNDRPELTRIWRRVMRGESSW